MDITPEIITDFRNYFNGQFSDVTTWPDNLLNEILAMADAETGGSGWGKFVLGDGHNFKRRGMYLYAAAYLSSVYGTDPSNGIASDARLNVADKSVGDEHVSYRVPQMLPAGDDFLTYTVYGQEFYRLRRRAGMGARAV